ncbi:glutamate-rich protein 2 isoform X2 [Dicentrarchus labrax]|uniref:glutamate-rich protein 2 isoform X2 n=1 Tax=Dicentrarchus labrax TaxID=13489 RepID=UPI001637D944|nr:glutamate-rich protein 2 isoform X2 [Dicentrarchus labrax]
MSRLECLGKSFTGSQKQLAEGAMPAHAETLKPNDKVKKKTVTDKSRRSLPARAPPHSVQETLKSGCPRGDMLNTDECSPKESINITPRVEEEAQSTAVPDDKLKMTDLRKAQTPGSAVTGGTTHAPPAVVPLPTHEAIGDEVQTEVEDAEEEDLKAPVELIMEFLRAVMDRDSQLASRLCQMILIYEPDNPEASEFLPLIQKKLLEEQEEEQSTEEDEEQEEDEDEEHDGDDDGNDSSDSESDEEKSQSSSCSSSSCSSSSLSDDDEEEEDKRVNRHKPCPPSHI